MKASIRIYLFTILLLICLTPARAEVRLPAIFNDHMVLQQQAEVKLWGWANPSEEVLITTSWDGRSYKTKGNAYAAWELTITTPQAGGPYQITIQGSNSITLTDLPIGEVWLASGQSNMQWAASYGIDDQEEAIAGANHPEIRLFQVARRASDYPQLDLEGKWQVCSPQTMRDFSAVGYFFARRLQRQLGVPIGIVHSSWGGTPAEAWINPAVVNNEPDLHAASLKQESRPYGPEKSGAIYNSMIAPITNFKIAGTIWYQGESNTVNAESYRDMFKAIILNWRQEWGYEFPFYYVQIAPFKYGEPEVGVLVREAQAQVLQLSKTGMVVSSDIGNIDDIHPRNKLDVGKRLANWALARTYGQGDMPYSGPLHKSIVREGRKIRIHFEHAEDGLIALGPGLAGFEIAGNDGSYVPAKAKIDGNTVLVWAREIKNPEMLRYGWSNTAEPTLFNQDGLPASSFRASLP